MPIGERIQKFRKQNHLSQEEMAEQLDVSKQSVSKWELDKAVSSVEKIIRMCEQFRVTCDFLLLGKEEEKEAKPELREADETMQKASLKEAGEVSESGRLSFPYDTGRMAAYALVALLFFAATLFFSIRIYQMRGNRGND